ncbi:MAG: hypothetical protein D6696_03160 [Acidobacteria bacterium]|nr:MAG: hypothetical protein D6696_03160 [Acidobacteriota bacterium]
MGIELELGFLLAAQALGSEIFAPFEVETPPWKKILKWALVAALTLGLYPLVGHWAILVTATLGLMGLTFHFVWCRKHGIDPWQASPRRRYYELRGWTWPDEAGPGAAAAP